jgi:hypothetical protein
MQTYLLSINIIRRNGMIPWITNAFKQLPIGTSVSEPQIWKWQNELTELHSVDDKDVRTVRILTFQPLYETPTP